MYGVLEQEEREKGIENIETMAELQNLKEEMAIQIHKAEYETRLTQETHTKTYS